MAKKKAAKKPDTDPTKPKRSYVSQSDVPNHTLADALRVSQAIIDNYAGDPTKPLHVASALNMVIGPA